MKKTLLLVAALTLQFAYMQAQQFETLPGATFMKNGTATNLPARQKAQPRHIALADNQVVMGPYDNDTYVTNLDYSSGVPNYTQGQVKWANLLPIEDLQAFEGGRIVKMRVAFAVAPGASTFFITPVTANGIGANLVEVTCNDAKAGWNEITLDTPCDIDLTGVEGYMMGCTYNQLNTNNGQYYNDECFPMSVVEEGSKQYPLYVYMNYNGRSAWYGLGSGNISVQAVVEGTFDGNAVTTGDYGQQIVPMGGTTTISLPVHNLGRNGISSIGYTVTTDGKTGDEQLLQLPKAFTQFNGYTTIDLPVSAAAQEGTEERVFTITKVNGQPNEAQAGTKASGLIASTSKSVTRRIAVEEYTGTACGWCPRGMVAMEQMRKAYPEQFIGIAVHQYNNSDPMYIEQYAVLSFSGAPQCTMDRIIYIDPSEAPSYINALLSIPAKAGVEVSGQWTGDNKVEATATVSSLIDGGRYGLEFVLVADSLKGSGTAWNQSNYYYQYTAAQGGAEVADFCKGGKYGRSSVSGLYFNDVAIASSYTGYENQIEPLVVAEEQPATVSYTLSLPTNTTLANAIKKEQVSVVALVIDHYDGIIVNSAKAPIGTELSAIKSVASAAGSQQPVARYSLDGRKLNAAQRGLNIVRLADGTVRKIVER